LCLKGAQYAQIRWGALSDFGIGVRPRWEKILSFDVPRKLIYKKDKIVKRIMGNYKTSLLLPTTVLGENELKENTK
jgi:hypothetical protein